MLLTIAALLGLGGAITAMGAQGPLKRLSWAIAAISLGALLLTFLLGPVAILVAVSAYGVALAVFPPFARSSHTALVRWLLTVLLAEVSLTTYFIATETDMIALWLMLFGPGTLASAARLTTEARQHSGTAPRD
ncbi:hypothetical protein [Streptomyces halobius]|uniref:Uncharacterized protein n=1 Tax=Streptomyces halobius TaxID=2879846 RepID=A0ABY4MD72_9ACTN|nr:hypothetical protein [Streptomyces halobius]UQA95663.1 hypothetical protein K9S39_30755 [Streptomyces halobius]